MKGNYPFSGVGSLGNFCVGLARLGVTNRVLVLIDNDAAGREVEQRLTRETLPSNIHLMRLPDLKIARNIRTIGPSGVTLANVNGLAVSIEWFLDLSSQKKPVVRWASYNKKMDCYQGELVGKEDYFQRFLAESQRNRKYDLSKLVFLWQEIISVCCK